VLIYPEDVADLEKRVGTLEQHMASVVATLDVLSTNQNRLDEVLETLAESHIRTQEQFRETDRRFAETDRRFAETDRRFAETDRRFAETDKRIADLVSAIGELVREMRGSRN